MNDKKVLALIDGDYLLYSCTAGIKLVDEYGKFIKKDNKFVYRDRTLEEVYNAVDTYLNSIFYHLNTKMYVGALTIGKCFRYRLNSTYKINREKLIKPNYFNECKDYLLNKWEFVYDVRLEADDIVNLCRHQYNVDYNCIIVSNDKDVLNLTGKYLNPRKMEFKETTREEEIIYFWKSMIVGDYIDGIPGLKQKGVAYFNNIVKDADLDQYPNIIFRAYLDYHGVDKGIYEFYKNYKSLKIVDNFDYKVPLIKSL